jgi:hypothetical protein
MMLQQSLALLCAATCVVVKVFVGAGACVGAVTDPVLVTTRNREAVKVDPLTTPMARNSLPTFNSFEGMIFPFAPASDALGASLSVYVFLSGVFTVMTVPLTRITNKVRVV